LLAILTNPPPRLFNIFEIADVETPGCRPVSPDVISYYIIDISND